MLDPEQRAAVTTTADRSLVLASAGSGKTRVLTHRIKHLLDNGAAPSEILAFSFTRKASDEIKSRLVEMIGPKAHACYLGTMHGIALRILRQYGDAIGYKRNATVYGDWEFDTLIESVARENGILRGKTWRPGKKTIMAAFDEFEQTHTMPDELDDAWRVVGLTMQRCRENNALPYFGLLHFFREFTLTQNVRDFFNWRYMLVDEVQDISKQQWDIIEDLHRANIELFATGDFSQSIYSFRSAYPEYLEKRKHTFNIVNLHTNYRSAPCIVEAANHLIANNHSPLTVDMVAGRQCEGRLTVAAKMKSANIAADIFAETAIRKWSDIAVLARTNKLATKVGQALAAMGVPVVVPNDKTSFLRSDTFQTFLAPLKLALNPHDNFAFLLCKHCFEIESAEYRSIRLQAAKEAKSHGQVFFERNPIYAKKAASFTEAPMELVITSLYETVKTPWCTVELYEKCRNTALELVQFGQSARDFLDYLALFDIQTSLAGEELDAVRCMTVHGAKGLEFPVVYVAGVNEGIMPSIRTTSTDADMREERRIAYVAWTRARDVLNLCVRPEVSEGGKQSPISRFVAESHA
jgi:DNA helicase-2/ATP-dependent DNA helicase PcrA